MFLLKRQRLLPIFYEYGLGIPRLLSSSSVPLPSPPQLFNSLENNAAYIYLKSRPEYLQTFFNPNSLESKWNEFSPIVHTFRDYLKPNHEFTHDFDDKILSEFKPKELNDYELKSILYLMTLPTKLPPPKSPKFQEFWSNLDSEMIERGKFWSYDECFSVDELWFLNRLQRFNSFNWNFVKRLFRKCDKLTKVQFIRFMFSLNLVRHLPNAINTYELEHCLNQHIANMNPVEVCITAMAFFKTETPIRDNPLFVKFIEIGMSESSTLESIFVGSLAKVGRLSGRAKTSAILYSFQEKFIPEISRLNITTAMHVAIISTRTQFLHEGLILTVLQKAETEIENTRLKEVERLLLVLTMFNIPCEKFCNLILSELRKSSREAEINQFGRVFDSIIFYLSMMEFYPFDLIDKVFQKENLKKNYGRNAYKYARELICLDYTVGLECPDYKGNRLEPKMAKSAIKHNMLWLWPETKEKVSTYEYSIRTVAQFMRKVCGGDEFIHTCCILPQFHSAEVVFFLNEENKVIPIPPEYKNLKDEEIKLIPNGCSSCHAVLIVSLNSVIRNKDKAILGQVKMQERQLKKLGYTVHKIFPTDVYIQLDAIETEERRQLRENNLYNLIFQNEDKTLKAKLNF